MPDHRADCAAKPTEYTSNKEQSSAIHGILLPEALGLGFREALECFDVTPVRLLNGRPSEHAENTMKKALECECLFQTRAWSCLDLSAET